MLDEIDNDIHISHNFCYSINIEDIENLLCFISTDYEVALKLFSSYGNYPFSKLPDYFQKTLGNVFDFKKKVKLFNQFIKEASISLKFDPFSGDKNGESLRAEMYQLFKDNKDCIKPKALYRKVKASLKNELLELQDEDYSFSSKKLIWHLQRDMKEKVFEIFIFLVTIGDEFDKKTKELNELNKIYESYLLNGSGAGFLKIITEDFNCYINEKDTKIRRRFSPGYGDWSISDRTKIIKLLKYCNLLNVSLTESYLILPEKTILGVLA